jgi:hypothetical protein
MLKKSFVGVIAAAAVSVPLAGTAWAAPPSDPNGVGPGGIPAKIGNNLGTDPTPPGSGVKTFAQLPGSSTPDAIHDAFPDTDRTPGGAVKRQTPGADSGNGPKGTTF